MKGLILEFNEYVKVKIDEEYATGLYEGYRILNEKVLYCIRITRKNGEIIGLKFSEDIRSTSKVFWFPKEQVETLTIQEQKELNKNAKKNSY
jgi:hypothetical protein